ncbi:MAG: pyridoxal phosphate-dependent aminotransferase [Ignavibacteriae bacterium]|nr:pyridoxal phosphate-dependent aminotransferase [Ignavibacteriota bacterium]
MSRLLEQRRRGCKPILDLTISNPTECDISYPGEEILSALANRRALRYTPDPRGIVSARQAIAGYYAGKGINVDPSQLVLTASTSEGCSFVFKLLCNPGDSVLVPVPSYPLFEFLAQTNDVITVPYTLHYDGEWHIDMDSMKKGITQESKAIVIVNPHNPTGMFLKRGRLKEICQLAEERGLAVIVDEVFADYPLAEDSERLISSSSESRVLTFTLNGISKLAGLPQLKLGWIVVSGESLACEEALARLELIADTFLSVNTPVQLALPELLRCGAKVRSQIQSRVRANLDSLRNFVTPGSACSVLKCEGGWYAVLRVPRTRTDEEWAMQLLDSTGVFVHPGYFFDFPEEGYLVLSLLTAPETFALGVQELIRFIQTG